MAVAIVQVALLGLAAYFAFRAFRGKASSIDIAVHDQPAANIYSNPDKPVRPISKS